MNDTSFEKKYNSTLTWDQTKVWKKYALKASMEVLKEGGGGWKYNLPVFHLKTLIFGKNCFEKCFKKYKKEKINEEWNVSWNALTT